MCGRWGAAFLHSPEPGAPWLQPGQGPCYNFQTTQDSVLFLRHSELLFASGLALGFPLLGTLSLLIAHWSRFSLTVTSLIAPFFLVYYIALFVCSMALSQSALFFFVSLFYVRATEQQPYLSLLCPLAWPGERQKNQ